MSGKPADFDPPMWSRPDLTGRHERYLRRAAIVRAARRRQEAQARAAATPAAPRPPGKPTP